MRDVVTLLQTPRRPAHAGARATSARPQRRRADGVRLPPSDPALARAHRGCSSWPRRASRARRRRSSPPRCAPCARRSCVGVAQQTYAEHVDSLDATTYLVKFTAEPIPGLGLLDLPLPAVMSADRPHARRARLGRPAAAPADRASRAPSCAAWSSGCSARWRYSLAERRRGRPRRSSAWSTARSSPRPPAPADAMIVATFDLAVKEQTHRVSLCLPFAGLHPHLVQRRRARARLGARARSSATAPPSWWTAASRTCRSTPSSASAPPAWAPTPSRTWPSATCCASRTAPPPARRRRRRAPPSPTPRPAPTAPGWRRWSSAPPVPRRTHDHHPPT